jgi:rhodanese-related sulfurtransferase
MSIQEIAVKDLKAALDGGGKLIDVRETDEYTAGHIQSATSIPLSTITVDFERFRSATDLYIVCKSGLRSMQACEFLVDQGIVNVVNVAGGTMAWQTSGNEVKLGEQP